MEILESFLEPLFDKVASHGAESRTLAERHDRLPNY